MKCVVFGGHGFVGRHLVPRLRETCTQVVVASRSTATDLAATVQSLGCDVGDGHAVRALLDDLRPEIIVNLASATRGSTEDICRTNVLGCLNILEAAKERSGSHLVTFGSAAEYGDTPCDGEAIAEDAPCHPVGVYGATKLAATCAALGLAKRFDVRVSVLRPFNIVGAGCPESLLVGAVIARVKAGLAKPGRNEIAVGRTDTSRDFIAVEDVVEAVIAVIRARAPSGVLNVCSGVPVSISDLLDTLRDVTNKAFSWRTDPSLVRPDDPPISFGTHARLTAVTGFDPRVPLVQSLRSAWLYAIAGESMKQVAT